MKTTLLRTPYAFLASSMLGLALLSVGAFTAHAQTNIPLCEINRGLTVGSSGEDVRCLQQYLNWSGYIVSGAGAGSPGQESAYFGQLTANAVARWQNAHAAAVLAPVGLTSGSGYFGASSFAHYVALVRIALGVSA